MPVPLLSKVNVFMFVHCGCARGIHLTKGREMKSWYFASLYIKLGCWYSHSDKRSLEERPGVESDLMQVRRGAQNFTWRLPYFIPMATLSQMMLISLFFRRESEKLSNLSTVTKLLCDRIGSRARKLFKGEKYKEVKGKRLGCLAICI